MNDETTHTPGPWEENGPAIETVATPTIVVAHVYQEYENSSAIGISEAFANAKLIAAAPELLDVARLLAKCGTRDKHGWLKCAPNDSDIEYAIETIKKATR